LNAFAELPLPAPNWAFLVYCLLGGVSQILFTFLLIRLFSFENFAVGTTYSKTEVVLVAILGLVLLGDTLSPMAALAIAICFAGVVVLSVARTEVTALSLFTKLAEKPTLIGLASGAFLGACVVFYRGATLALGGGDFRMRAAFALAVSMALQTAIMGAYLYLREPGQLTAVIRSWRSALAVGAAGILASICWFTAFAIQNGAYVRALGQIELIFTFIASAVFFKERTNALEYCGIGLIVVAILILILAR
jgi:drug/metabolite transporter (DMT)-like permease